MLNLTVGLCVLGFMYVFGTLLYWFILHHEFLTGWMEKDTTLLDVLKSHYKVVVGLPKFLKSMRLW